MVLRSIKDRYDEALNAFNNGDSRTAEEILTEVVDETADVNSEYFLAVIKSQKGEYKAAIENYKNVVSRNPCHPEAFFNLALCSQKLEIDDEAIEYYLKALEINPNLDDAYNNLALIYQNRGDYDSAEKYLLMTGNNSSPEGVNESSIGELEFSGVIPEIKEAAKYIKLGNLRKAKEKLEDSLSVYEDNKNYLCALGNVSFHLEDYQDALEYFQKACEIENNDHVVVYSIAVCLQRLDRKDEAFSFYKKSIEIKPDFPDALNNIALIYFHKKDYEKAEDFFSRALQADPEHINSIVNYGSTKTFLNDYEAASSAFELAVNIAKKRDDKTNLSVIYTNMGFLELRKSNLQSALELFDKSLELDPEYVIGNYNKGETLLKLGKFEEGWKHYEKRMEREEFGPRKFHKLLNSLENIAGKKILIYAEQGLGDALHFLRYLKLLKRDGAYVIFECDKGLHPLIAETDYIDELLERISTEKRDIDYDFDIPLLSLAKLYKTDLNDLPLEIPYINACEEKTEYWKQFIGNEGFKVGLVWGGAPVHQNDKNRSVKLSALSFLFGVPGAKFYSLQKGIPQLQLSDYALIVKDLDQIGIKSWADTAAIIENLDLVITVDTSVCHLAGAMGKEVWVMLPSNSDWRWLLEREDSPWYPSMKLYRQKSLGDWTDVFKRLENDLRNKINPAVQDAEFSMVNSDNDEQSEDSGNSASDEYQLEIPQELSDEIAESVFSELVMKLNIPENPAVALVGGFESNIAEKFAGISDRITVFSYTDNEYKHYSEADLGSAEIIHNSDTPGKKYDLIWSRYFLNQADSPNTAIEKIGSMLNNNGIAYIEAPAENTEVEHETSIGNNSILGIKMWKALFERGSFEIISSDTIEIKLDSGVQDKNYYFLLKKKSANHSDETNNSASPLILSLPSGENFGWGICSKYIRRELKGRVEFYDAEKDSAAGKKIKGKVFQALQNQNFEPMNDIWGDENYGYTFFEYELTDRTKGNAKKYDKVIAGSSWCRDKMHDKGIMNTEILLQGIDPDRFYPGEKEKHNDLFVIFSGGKFELRKGQDLVLKAFQILQQKYSDIILMNAWYNLWPHTLEMMRISPHIKFDMDGETWKNKMINLCKANGIDGNRVFTLPAVPNDKLRDVYLNTDIGLFPNRCEGGTNLVLMEYMACGKPVIASFNSGHKDILTDDNSIKLTEMSEFRIQDENNQVVADWKEPSLDEIIAKIEWAYENRNKLKSIGENAAKDMKNFTWRKTAENLIKLVY